MMNIAARLKNLIADSPFFSEGVFLFFPVSACYAVLMPFIWVVFYQLSYPGTNFIPPQQWHAHEMIFGFYSAALAGFLCSAIAEWTDTRPLNQEKLLLLLALWLPGRLIGLFGYDCLVFLTGAFDIAFLILLLFYISVCVIKKRNWRSLSFLLWLSILFILELLLNWSWWYEENELASRLLWSIITVFVILFSLSITRINTVIVNLSLDPTGETSPYRPHPGRRNLAAFLATIYALSMLFFPWSQMQYYFAFAAAAGFMDRTAEWFIGKAVLKTEVLCLALANICAGIGFLFIGLSGFFENISIYAGLHILTIGSLALAVIGVFTIAGLRHSGRDLIKIPWQSKLAIVFIILSTLIRALPEISDQFSVYGYHYIISSVLWSFAFFLWLLGYMPILKYPVRN